jgi:uncharacterized protein YbjT (DUF2867 family)
MDTFAVTGAFGFSGRHIAARLLANGAGVRSLTNHPHRPDPFGGRVRSYPLAFDDVVALRRALEGADVLVNTYWVRYDHDGVDHRLAVERSGRLFTAAVEAGVQRIVHVSIANPDPASPLSYYRGKAEVEAQLRAIAPSYAIIRPTVLFGDEPILPNTIAWLLRRLPLFGIPGNGRYPIQPVAVDDLADLAVELAAAGSNRIVDAVGPDVFTFADFVRHIRDAVGSRARLVHVPPAAGLAAATVLGRALGDVILTRQELDGLMTGLLVSREPATGRVRFDDWLGDNAHWLGRAYLSELGRHFAAPSPPVAGPARARRAG